MSAAAGGEQGPAGSLRGRAPAAHVQLLSSALLQPTHLSCDCTPAVQPSCTEWQPHACSQLLTTPAEIIQQAMLPATSIYQVCHPPAARSKHAGTGSCTAEQSSAAAARQLYAASTFSTPALMVLPVPASADVTVRSADVTRHVTTCLAVAAGKRLRSSSAAPAT